MCGYTRMDNIRNEDVQQKVGVANMNNKMWEARLRRFGHVQRGSPDS